MLGNACNVESRTAAFFFENVPLVIGGMAEALSYRSRLGFFLACE